ncbi:hypothetical protein K493DRAFT_299289 [Basidiobolus meristosporus CBS 931.73]|uniref:Uncharacterized protein n=1 Tax=Basidiobolus meristosporus CBS 931.73 TaxID=1314790 RepID=A0A1Y1YNH4_9FUNG|nr:hypothetical protein K493DRAFT_299289 [Basidiobolus meristosporus CBS 931.73]|eukprot:ORX99569.1 hypothetical protein K493DRAFT_299289 [Basidiobolus meristosporus CBS 931.73]
MSNNNSDLDNIFSYHNCKHASSGTLGLLPTQELSMNHVVIPQELYPDISNELSRPLKIPQTLPNPSHFDNSNIMSELQSSSSPSSQTYHSVWLSSSLNSDIAIYGPESSGPLVTPGLHDVSNKNGNLWKYN